MAVVLYVSTDGDDQFSGRVAERTGEDGPLASVQAARDKIRSLRKSGEAGPFAVEIRGGWYFLDHPLVLEPEDSGTAETPIVYRAYAGEQPKLSGGMKIEGFEETEINGQMGWVTDVPSDLKFTQLFVNGQRMSRPRLPEKGFYRMASAAELDEKVLDWYTEVRSFVYKEGDIDPNWRNPEDWHIMSFKRWFDIHLPVESVEADTRTVHLKSNITEGGKDCDGQMLKYYIENVYEALRHDGQFYLDQAAAKLYYLPRYGDKPHSAFVVAPRLKYLLQLEGDPFGATVHDVHFENLTFCHSEYRYEPGYSGSVQAAHTLPGAITLRGAHDCVLFGCTVMQVAQYAIEMRLGCSGNKVVACHLHDLGGGGVKVNHDRGTASESHEAAVQLRKEPEFGVVVSEGQDASKLPRQKAEISDCRIHDGGKIYQSAVGIWIGDSASNRIRHNEIWNMHYSGISIGWMWVFNYEIMAADNIAEYNHVHHINVGGLLSDLAGIYTLGPQPGSINRYNLLHDIDTAVYGDWGLYHDGSSSFFDNVGNVLYRCGYGAYFSNVGKNNRIRQSILINDKCADNPALVIGDDQGLLAATVEDCLLFSHTPQMLLNQGGVNHGHSRFYRNVMADPIGRRGYAGRDFENRMWDEEEWVSSEVGHDDQQITYEIHGDENGNLDIPADAPFMNDQWREVLAEIEKVGPRYRHVKTTSYAAWPYKTTERPRAIVMPVFELDIPMFDEEKGTFPTEFYKARLCVNSDRAVTGHLRLINRGEVQVSGKVSLYFEHASDGEIGWLADDTIDLHPGESVRLPFTAKLSEGVDKALVYAATDTDAFFPVGMFLYAAE